MAEVRIAPTRPPRWRAHGAPIARAEGFAVHAESMEARIRENGGHMSRSAEIHRSTGETDVRSALGLDGTGAGARDTGVGFLDHMLDLLARHGRLDLDVAVEGDLQTGSHHTVEDVGICLGQALDEALGDRAGIFRYGHAVVPMDEARASCAIDVSGRAFCALDGPSCRRARSATSTTSCRRSSSAPSRAPRRLTLHLSVEAGTNAHHMIEALLQGVRARAAGGGRDRSRARPACPARRGR